jgi:hypothetical protein
MAKKIHEDELKRQLQQWGRGPVENLAKMYRAHASNPNFFEALVRIYSSEQEFQTPVAWLVKHHYSQGHRLPKHVTEALMACCHTVEAWPARIYLLQLIPQMDLSSQSLLRAEDLVRSCLKDSNTFVRAWAINGLHALTRYVPELTAEVLFICEKALETETAAIKSRVRKILAEIQA